MEVYQEGIKNYPEDPTRFYNFSRFKSLAGDFLLIHNIVDWRKLGTKNKKIVYLEFEEPNRLWVPDASFNHIPYEDYFYKIFTICPYTSKWLNQKYSNNKRTFVFFPFNEQLIPKKNNKIFDVFYSGHLRKKNIIEVAQTISKYNYKIVSHSNHKLVTDRSVSYQKKLEIASKSKISVVHNLLFLGKDQLNHLYQIDGWENNEAFHYVPKPGDDLKDSEVLVPQLKSRVFEAAFSQSLILCRKDPFNIIEYFFEPNKEFIYYQENELDKKIAEILKNYNEYLPIVQNAYEKAKNKYTTKAFFDKYLKGVK
ncbi:glycosyltransferase [Alkalihalobacillus sp. BA299]|uniref:glycosyltransferase n=1 Tax=Alkalihalobacillus sp. BA299 TaxID=2815938 RepID=UPI001ADC83D0|nr:glycosyltransferase [Alkalihalobacillus sp. BA299]